MFGLQCTYSYSREVCSVGRLCKYACRHFGVVKGLCLASPRCDFQILLAAVVPVDFLCRCGYGEGVRGEVDCDLPV